MPATPKQIEQLLAAERVRVDGIVNSTEGKARPTLAMHLALKSPMSVDEAIAMLSVAAPETRNTTSAAESFARALSAETIGVTTLGAEVATDKREARLKEIRRNVGKKGAANAE